MKEVIAKRREKLIEKMPETAQAILVTNEKNQYYLTGFHYSDGYALVTREKSYLLTDSRYIEAATNEACDGFEVLQIRGKATDFVQELLTENHVETVLYEDNNMTCAAFARWSAGLKTKMEPAKGLIEELREYKDEYEIDCIVRAQRIAERAFDHILEYITPERTEKEVALELEYTMRKYGAEGASFDIIAVSGSASSLPHGVPRDVKLEKGFLTMDYGCLVEGYCSDMTRTVCIGHATDEMKQIYDTVYRAQQAGIENIFPGLPCVNVDEAARKIIREAGYGDYFGHGLGHGVGLDIHESPRLSPMAGEKMLREGHVVTVEPGIYLPGKFGVRIEDMVVVRETWHSEDITHCPKHLIEIL